MLFQRILTKQTIPAAARAIVGRGRGTYLLLD